MTAKMPNQAYAKTPSSTANLSSFSLTAAPSLSLRAAVVRAHVGPAQAVGRHQLGHVLAVDHEVPQGAPVPVAPAAADGLDLLGGVEQLLRAHGRHDAE